MMKIIRKLSRFFLSFALCCLLLGLGYYYFYQEDELRDFKEDVKGLVLAVSKGKIEKASNLFTKKFETIADSNDFVKEFETNLEVVNERRIFISEADYSSLFSDPATLSLTDELGDDWIDLSEGNQLHSRFTILNTIYDEQTDKLEDGKIDYVINELTLFGSSNYQTKNKKSSITVYPKSRRIEFDGTSAYLTSVTIEDDELVLNLASSSATTALAYKMVITDFEYENQITVEIYNNFDYGILDGTYYFNWNHVPSTEY